MLIGYHSSKQAEQISTTSLFIQSDVKAEVCIFQLLASVRLENKFARQKITNPTTVVVLIHNASFAVCLFKGMTVSKQCSGAEHDPRLLNNAIRKSYLASASIRTMLFSCRGQVQACLCQFIWHLHSPIF